MVVSGEEMMQVGQGNLWDADIFQMMHSFFCELIQSL